MKFYPSHTLSWHKNTILSLQMYNGRRRSQGEGGNGVVPPGQGEGRLDVRIECDICLDTCHHPTSTQCCQAQVPFCFSYTTISGSFISK